MQYEILLKAYQAVLRADRREAINQSHMVGKEVDDGLLRLQTGYAKACAVLQRHVCNCEVQFFAKSSAHNSHGSEQAPEGGYPLEESAERKHR